jgi:hypothetical protein
MILGSYFLDEGRAALAIEFLVILVLTLSIKVFVVAIGKNEESIFTMGEISNICPWSCSKGWDIGIMSRRTFPMCASH